MRMRKYERNLYEQVAARSTGTYNTGTATTTTIAAASARTPMRSTIHGTISEAEYTEACREARATVTPHR
jgi:hypothetical protein